MSDYIYGLYQALRTAELFEGEDGPVAKAIREIHGKMTNTPVKVGDVVWRLDSDFIHHEKIFMKDANGVVWHRNQGGYWLLSQKRYVVAGIFNSVVFAGGDVNVQDEIQKAFDIPPSQFYGRDDDGVLMEFNFDVPSEEYLKKSSGYISDFWYSEKRTTEQMQAIAALHDNLVYEGNEE